MGRFFCVHGMAFAFPYLEAIVQTRRVVMENHDVKCSAQTVVLAFVGGAVAGVVAGLLLAPQSGQDTRRALKGHAGRAEEEVIEKAKEARAALDETIERGKLFLAEKKAAVEAAVKAGKEAMKERGEKCCS
jgi:gas vesicle protein